MRGENTDRSARARLQLGLALLLSALVVSLAGVWWLGRQDVTPEPTEPGAGPTEPNEAAAPTPTDKSLVISLSEVSRQLSRQVRRAVVRIDAQLDEGSPPSDDLAQLFGAPPPLLGQGSGVVVDADGLILTNYHVVRQARRISVVFSQQDRSPAKVVGSDTLTDLALLEVDVQNLQTITWGDSDAIQTGEFVWAIGSPFGLEGSVSFGIISAKNRVRLGSPFQDFLQTDAAVNPGNSGGALVDVNGHVVGINTAIIGDAFRGVSFAIPSNTARQVYRRLRDEGRVARGWLGMELEAVSAGRATQLGLVHSHGAFVVSVVTDPRLPSPAQQAGIRTGDVVVMWNDEPVDNPISLMRLIAQSTIQSRATVTVIRDGHQLPLAVQVGERPDR